MTGRSNDDIFEAIGGLRAEVAGLRHDMDNARVDRKQMYDKLDEQGRRLGHVERDILEIKPTVKEISQLKYKAAGAVLVLGVIGAVIGGVATFFIAEIKAFVFRLLGY